MSIVSDMLKNPDIKDWYDEMIFQGSDITIEFYIRRLSRMLEFMKETPESILELNKEKLYKKMMAFAMKEKKNGKAPSYIMSEFKAIYSYLKHKDVDFKRIPNPKNSSSTPTVQDEVIPTKEELSRILHAASPRDKVSISLMAFAGVRPAVIGDIHGGIGLKMGDLKEWEIKDNQIFFETPLKIKVKPDLSKTSRPYITFMCEEGCKYLKYYIDERIREGEEINEKTPVVRSVYKKKLSHIGSNAIRYGIRHTFSKAGIKKRPYVLRRYFASKMMEGEYNGVITHSFAQFMMGHQGDMMAEYTTNKGLLNEQMERIKKSYEKCQEYLQTNVTKIEIQRTQERMNQMENKSNNMEEVLFDRITKLEKEKNGLKEIIDTLKDNNNELQKWLVRIGKQTGIMNNNKND